MMDAGKLRDIVLNARQPIVLRNVELPWKCLKQTFQDWCQTFDSLNKELITFDGSTVKSGLSQQWESQRTKIRMTMGDFYKTSSAASERWNTFSYRNIDELPEPCREGINFEPFGFPEVKKDITFWIGSAHAHTPCHYDTYGCNIVVQVYGRKSWILLPPEAKLTPVRVPFEESSVYCKENFYSPASYGPFTGVENEVYHTVLEPGMALIVPPKWWHFVENLEPSLNFNTWLSLERDVDSLITECITKTLIQDICSGLPQHVHKHVLNPNEDSIITNTSIEESRKILSYLLYQKRSNKQQRLGITRYPFGYLLNDVCCELLVGYESIAQSVQQLQPCDFFYIMKHNNSRYDATIDTKYNSILNESDTEILKRIEKLINVCCAPDIVRLIEIALLCDCDFVDIQ